MFPMYLKCGSSFWCHSSYQEENCVRCNEEQSGVSVSQALRTEYVIAALREEISALRLQLSQSIQSDPDIRHKLTNLAKDIEEKKEEIQELKKQVEIKIDIFCVKTRGGYFT